MKTKMMKRAAAFAASVLMTAAMAVPVSANSNPDPVKTSTSKTAPAPVLENPASIDLTKTIKMYNTDGAPIYEPNITYTYTLSSANVASGVTIKGLLLNDDTNTGTVAVTSGSTAEDGAVLLQYGSTKATSVALEFGDDSVPTIAPEVSETFKIVTDAAKFPKAGVYRYTIQQTVDKAAAGVGEDEDDVFGSGNLIYLDVYVKKAENGEDLETYGLVLFKAGESNTSFEYDENAEADALKIDTLDPDEYRTYNVKLEKIITGSMADKNQDFTFNVKMSGSIADAEITYDVKQQGGTTKEHGKVKADESVTMSGFYAAQEYQFRNEDYIEIFGIPALPDDAMLYAYETNDSPDTYNLTVTKNGSVVNEYTAELKPGDKSNESAEFAIRNDNNSEDEILFTNTLDAISPTGVLFRIAPYALMMTAGGVLIAVYLRGKKREDAESMI